MIRIFTFLSIGAALIVIVAELLRVVIHFVFKVMSRLLFFMSLKFLMTLVAE